MLINVFILLSILRNVKWFFVPIKQIEQIKKIPIFVYICEMLPVTCTNFIDGQQAQSVKVKLVKLRNH